MSFQDDWPLMVDGSKFDGRGLLRLLRQDASPFAPCWDVALLIKEVEDNLDTIVTDIPFVHDGANNYGFELRLTNPPGVIARITRGDVNMPDYDGFPFHVQLPRAKFEAAVYTLLEADKDIVAAKLLYHRLPLQYPEPGTHIPSDIAGRSLLIFEKTEGENRVWVDLDDEQKAILLGQLARIRAALFNFELSGDFAATWFLQRLFEQKPKSLLFPVTPTRAFCVALFKSKIQATIKEVGDMIGWEDDHVVVGPVAYAAKASLLRLIPYILPGDEPSLYRLVLEHGDFGIHNMSIVVKNHRPDITSLYDWETGCIVPAILSDPTVAVKVAYLRSDRDANPSVSPFRNDTRPDERARHQRWAQDYLQTLFQHAPNYERAIKAGKDARHLWFALQAWRGQDPEGYFGELGAWAESRIRELKLQ